jgi:hypothetical protein
MSTSRVRIIALGQSRLVFIGMVLVIGCKGDQTPTEPLSSSIEMRSARSILNPRNPRGFEDVILQVEEAVPGFGGMSIDENGKIVAWISSPTDEPGLRAHLATMVARMPDFFRNSHGGLREIVVRPGGYAFSHLVSWKDGMRAAAVLGARVFDADEGLNKVRIGIKDPQHEPAIRALAAKYGIPQEAISFDLYRGTIEAAASVQDQARPTKGGIRISHVWSAGDTTYCTLGLNVKVSGVPYFATASHCTHSYTGNASTDWHQAKSPNQIGVEAINPAWTTTGCLAFYDVYCNTIDVALVSYDSWIQYNNQLVQTSTVGTGSSNGNLTIGSTFNVAFTNVQSQGDSVYKTGAVGGSTRGIITGTCVDVDSIAPAPIHNLFCQYEAGLRVEPGDSGGPAYRFRFPLSTTYREPEGIFHTRFAPLPGYADPYKAWFSQTAQIDAALGTITWSW